MLRYWLQRMQLDCGWNESLFNILKMKAETMKPQDRVCGVIFDAVSLKEGITYNIHRDKFNGFEDLGQYGSSGKPATYAMVFMAKGLASKWKQVLGYFLFNKSIKPNLLKEMLHDCISKLKMTGMIPKFVVADQDVTNRSVYSKLNISTEKPYITHNNENVYFFL